MLCFNICPGPIEITEDDATNINEEKPKFQHKVKPEMLDETKRLLQEFYKPFNEELARTLNDNRYLWSELKR